MGGDFNCPIVFFLDKQLTHVAYIFPLHFLEYYEERGEEKYNYFE